MKWTKRKVVEIITETAFVLFATIFIIQLILKILGHSPIEFQIVIGGFVAIFIFLIGATKSLAYRLGRIDEKLVSTDQRLVSMDNRLSGTERRLLAIEKKLTKIEAKI